MSAIAPSFAAKLDRAEKHLIDLKGAIAAFAGTDSRDRPYTVRTSVQGKRKRQVHRLHFTRTAENTDIPLIVADAIYNLRSSLEHLMGSLVASKDRNSVTFPIFWRGVHEPPIAGENDQRRKDRQRWTTIDRAAPDGVITFLKRLQPPDDAPNSQTPHALRLLNQLSNNDRHTKLPVFADSVEGLIIEWQLPDGQHVQALARPKPEFLLEDQAEITNVPEGAVYVDCYGPPRVVIRTALRNDHGAVNLPVVEFIEDTLGFIRTEVVPGLVQYVHTPPKRRR